MANPNESRWTGVDEKLALEILREGEEYLRSQWQSALAADQRAMNLLTAATTLGAGVVAATGALIAVDKLTNAFLLSAITWEITLVFSIVFSAITARPIAFFHPGNRPSHWGADDFKNPPSQALGEQADAYDRCIEKNRVTLRDNGKWLIRALVTFGISPLIAGATFLAAWALKV